MEARSACAISRAVIFDLRELRINFKKMAMKTRNEFLLASVNILLHNSSIRFEFCERGNRERVKLATHVIDVGEGKSARVRSIGEKNKDAHALRVVPATRAGKA